MKRLLGLLLLGCQSFPEAVVGRASLDFQCSEQEIRVVPVAPRRQPQAAEASGCGRRQQYEGGCDLGGCLVEPLHQPGDVTVPEMEIASDGGGPGLAEGVSSSAEGRSSAQAPGPSGPDVAPASSAVPIGAAPSTAR